MAEDRGTTAQKEANERLVRSTLEFAVELDEAAVKRWIDERWPNGFGSHEIRKKARAK